MDKGNSVVFIKKIDVLKNLVKIFLEKTRIEVINYNLKTKSTNKYK